ncbi:MAG: glycosyltransferase family 4 protein [Acetobacteraceae bacterium]|nr:glycosyltransferase family 4 protein [Acetobacteraceae bacterium]
MISAIRPPRLAFLLLPSLDHFAQDLLAHLPTAGGWEVRGFKIRSAEDYATALAWADQPEQDVIWFEFCWPPFPQLIAQTDFGGRRVIVRVHRIEATETDHVARTPWAKVNDVIVVSADMAARVSQATTGATRLHLVHNGLDLDRFKASGEWNPFRIGWCGLMILRKNPVFALQILAALRNIDPRYHLHVSSSGGEKLAIESFFHLTRRLGLTDAVHCDGTVPQAHMPAWHARNGILLHTSLHEGLSYAVLEAAACGCDIAMLDHPGADTCWPPSVRFGTLEEAVTLIRNAAPQRWREYVAAHFSLAHQVGEITAILRS